MDPEGLTVDEAQIPGPPHFCENCSEVYDEASGDGYCGLCPSCADKTVEECSADGHVGPVVPTGEHEIIDHGVGIFFRCEHCGAVGDSSIDLSDIEFHSEPADV